MEIIAHRGASFDAPENTLPAIQLAWDQNADAVEIDVHISSDNHVVAIHDSDTTRTASLSHRISNSSLTLLQSLDVGTWKDPAWSGTPIPTLEQVLAILPPGKRLFIELKFPLAQSPAFIQSCRKLDPKPLVLIGFSLELVAAVKSALPQIESALVAELKPAPSSPKSWIPSIETLIQMATHAGLDGLDLNAKAPLTTSAVRQIHNAGLKCYVWTCDSPARARQLAQAGIDGITTNRPGWLKKQLADSQP